MNTVLDELMLDIEDFQDFEGGNAPIVVSGEITNFEANKWITSREVIVLPNGRSISLGARMRFTNPILTSITQRQTTTSTRENRNDFNATVVAGREMEVEVGDDFVPLATFICDFLRKANPAMTRSNEQILLDLKTYGLDIHGRLPMYIQQLGSDPDRFKEVAAHFQSLGAVNNSSQVASRQTGTSSRLMSSFRVEEGIPIHHLEISHVNREMSQSNSGFIGFLDAFWNTFSLAIAIDKQRTANAKVLEADPTNAEAAAAEAAIRNLFSTPRLLRSFRNWGGTSKVVAPLDGSIEYYPVQVPCGRFSVLPVGIDRPHTYSVWANNTANRANAAAGIPETDEDAAAAPGEMETPAEEPY
jgi:hypothetical protein